MYRKIPFLFLLVLLLVTLTACDTTTTEEPETPEPTATRHVTYSDVTIKHDFDGMQMEIDELKGQVATATNETAQTIKNEIAQMELNVETFDAELNEAVKNAKLTEDVKRGYDTTIETLKTELNEMNATLDGIIKAA